MHRASIEKYKIGINREVHDFDQHRAFERAVDTKVSKRLGLDFLLISN